MKYNKVVQSPIFYVNAQPHIGHLYTAVVCDATNRFNLMKYGQQQEEKSDSQSTKSAFFSIGTDEHGLKIQKNALEKNYDSPLDMCDKFSNTFKDLFKRAGIEEDDFVRTTQARHYKSVEKFWERLDSRGFIHKGTHEGYYSTNEETFFPEKDLEKNPNGNGLIYPATGEVCELVKEENFVFKATDEVKNQVLKWASQTNSNSSSHNSSIYPNSAQNKILSELGNINEISISRPRARLQWGIPVPNDPNQTVYVWLDALTNYLTVLGYPDLTSEETLNHNIRNTTHIIGRDIAKFHCIYYPLFLSAAGLDLPNKVITHCHWLQDGMKMSKSLGNVTCPNQLLDLYGESSVRAYCLAEGPAKRDQNFDMKRLQEVNNNVLADQFSNLFNRVTGKKILKIMPEHFRGDNKKISDQLGTQDLAQQINSLSSACLEDLDRQDFGQAFQKIKQVVYLGNNLLSTNEFWTLAKSGVENGEDRDKLEHLLFVTFEIVRISSTLLLPFCPTLASKMLKAVNAEDLFKSETNDLQTKVQFDFEKTIKIDKTQKVFIQKVED